MRSKVADTQQARLYQVVSVSGNTVTFNVTYQGAKQTFSVDAESPQAAKRVAVVLAENLGMTMMQLGGLAVEV